MARSLSPLDTSTEEGLGVCGIEPDRFIVVGDGAVVVALVVVGATSILEGHGEFWIEADRLIVVGGRAVVVALFVISGTPIVEGHGQFGIEPDRLTQVGDGALEVAPFVISGSSIVAESRQVASFPFPRIDAPRTVNDRGLGVLQTITLVSGGRRITQEYHGGKKRAPKSPVRGAHAISLSGPWYPEICIRVCCSGSQPTGQVTC